MQKTKRPLAFRIIVAFFGVTLIMLLMGQTMAVLNYDAAVRLGLQESRDKVSEFGVQVNRAFGAGDTLVYLPLIAVALAGLFLRKRWALIVAASAMGISIYWPVSAFFMLLFLRGVDGYHLAPGMEYWSILTLYVVLGLWGFFYLLLKGEKLIE